MYTEILKVEGIKKSFSGVHALDGARFELRKGEVHGLIGENGAGKSTLMKILSGIHTADEGAIYYNGYPIAYRTPREALDGGICIIHQELNLIPHLSIADNIFIGREYRNGCVLDKKRQIEEARGFLKEVGLDIDPETRINQLTVARQQMVEIAKALSYNFNILIMDEPTAALAEREINELFRVIATLAQQGKAIVYISHRLEELLQITDRITVMRDGKTIDTVNTNETDMRAIIDMMVGREIQSKRKERNCTLPDAEVVLEAKNLKSKDIHDVSLKLHRGEILGIAGLMGAGRTELVRLLFGADPKIGGQILINGKEVIIKQPKDAVKHGMGYISEDRKQLGLAVNMTVSDNIVLTCFEKYLSFGIINHKRIENDAKRMIDTVHIKTPSSDQMVRNLSGGNQQKVVIAKWLLRNCDIVIFDEPTRGIDVGAKSEIYTIMEEMISLGKSIIMISSEMPEILRMSDRILVMCEGRKTAELDISEADQEKIMYYATMR